MSKWFLAIFKYSGIFLHALVYAYCFSQLVIYENLLWGFNNNWLIWIIFCLSLDVSFTWQSHTWYICLRIGVFRIPFSQMTFPLCQDKNNTTAVEMAMKVSQGCVCKHLCQRSEISSQNRALKALYTNRRLLWLPYQRR